MGEALRQRELVFIFPLVQTDVNCSMSKRQQSYELTLRFWLGYSDLPMTGFIFLIYKGHTKVMDERREMTDDEHKTAWIKAGYIVAGWWLPELRKERDGNKRNTGKD